MVLSTPAGPAAALALLLGFFPIADRASAQSASGAQITLAFPDISLGSVTPQDSPDQPRFSQGVTILSDQPWTLQLLARDLSSAQTVNPLGADRLLWRLRGDRFRPLASDLPILLSPRPPTGPTPVTLFLEFAIRSDWTVAPGNYTGTLTFVLNTAGSSRPTYLQVVAPIRLAVARFSVMQILGSTVDSPAVDPTRAEAFPYAPIQVAIRSNTDWSLSAEPMDDFMHEKAASRLPLEILSASSSPSEHPRVLERGKPNSLASGSATGNTEVRVVLYLKARLAGGEPAGRYRLPLRLRLSTAGIVGTVS